MTWFGSPGLGLDLYHVGLVVPDLDAAMQQHSALLGFDWSPPGESRFDVRVDGSAQQARIRVTYSVQGPPYLELVEDLTGVWGRAGLGLSHVGCWSEDLPADVARAEAAGLPARVSDDGGLFSYHELSPGLWLELVSTAFRSRLAARLARSTSGPPA